MLKMSSDYMVHECFCEGLGSGDGASRRITRLSDSPRKSQTSNQLYLVATQSLRIMCPSMMLGDAGEPRNSCIEAVAGNETLMQPWPQYGWRGNILVVGYSGDVTMRDFRAIVDFFQCYANNNALVDPSRHL